MMKAGDERLIFIFKFQTYNNNNIIIIRTKELFFARVSLARNFYEMKNILYLLYCAEEKDVFPIVHF